MREESRNTILGIVLSGVVLIAWQYFFNVPAMERQRQHLPPLESPLQAFFREHFTDFGFLILVTGSVLIIATGLYLLREHRRRVYAGVEIVFGIAAGHFAANTFFHAASPEQRVQASVAAIGGIYIIVRGFDNFMQGQAAANAKRPPPRNPPQFPLTFLRQ